METVDSVGHTDERMLDALKARVGGMEAEDIVADAIKLNVDDDLNEHREEHEEQYDQDAQDEDYYDGQEHEEEPNYEEDDETMGDDEQSADKYDAEDGDEHAQEEENDDQEYDNSQEQDFGENHPEGEDESQDMKSDVKKSESAESKETTTTNKSHNNSTKKSSNSRSNEERSSSNHENNKKSSSTANGCKLDKSKSTKSSSSSKDTSSKPSTDAKQSTKSKSSSAKSKEEGKESKNNRDKESREHKDAKDNKDNSKDKDHKDRSKHQEKDNKDDGNDRVLWVSGLTSNVRASDLQNLFKKHGTVIGAKIIKNTRIPGSRFYGLITMETAQQAQDCIQNLNHAQLDGKEITVEKNRLSERRQNVINRERREANNSNANRSRETKDNKDNKNDRDRRRNRSPRRRSASPNRRFARPFNGPRRGGFANSAGRGRGAQGGNGVVGRASFGGVPGSGYFNERAAGRRREVIREDERRRSELDERRAREIERLEREKLERERMRLRLERERLEREKAEFLRMEREKARLERERIEREREELRRKASQLPHRSSASSAAPLASSSSAKRSYEDTFGWDDRKRFSSSSGVPAPAPAAVTGPSLSSRYEDEYDRRKLDPFRMSGRSAGSSELEPRRSSGHDRDERRAAASSNGATLGYGRESMRSALVAERSAPERNRPSLNSREQHRSSSDWKSDHRRDSRFLEKPLSSGNGFISSRHSFGNNDSRGEWGSSSLSKLSYGPGASDSSERPRMIQIPIERDDQLNLYGGSGAGNGQAGDSFSSLSAVYRRF